MSPQGEERPPERPEEPERPDPEQPEEPERPEPDRPDKPERPEKPEYTVYGRGSDSGERREAPRRADKDAKGEKPTYRVYRARPSLLDRFRKPGLTGLRGASAGGLRERLSKLGGGGRRRWLRWVLIAVGVWILISFVSFAISAQIQKGELDDRAKEALAGGPDLLAGQNILILGGDRRGSTQRNAAGTEGQGPPRADSIIVLHASLTSFRKLSIPRDTYAAIPDCGTQKINASLACNTNSPKGNAASTINTVEDFLGIDINHIIIVDFDGFADFINTLGGITIDVPRTGKGKGPAVCGDVDGGKAQGGVSLKLTPGEHDLEGDKALAYARIRSNRCDPAEDDVDRAARQQAVLNGVKGQLTSITRLPYNFIKGPFIGWDAPRAFISDMGGLTLPQLAIAAIFGGSGKTNVLEPSGTGPGSSLLISQGECEEAVEELTGGAPEREPACSP
jgi:LCP family protein required for cell wall assembly